MVKMKKIVKFLLFSFAIIPFFSVSAMDAGQVRSRETTCPNIELAIAKADGSLETVQCYDQYTDAKLAMDTNESDDAVLLQGRMIIDAKYALVDYDQATSTGYIEVFKDVTLTQKATYIRGGDSDDAVYLGVDYNTGRIRIKVSGVDGYIAKYQNEGTKTNQQYDIVPLVWVTSPSYYEITNETIVHHLPKNVYNTKGEYSLRIGRKPEMLEIGNYYSYDGIYFYKDLKVMINDYKNKVSTNAVNATNPFYNYYQYMSFRTKTNYNSANLDQFIASRTVGKNSVMTNTGTAFIDAQEKYGINAAMMLAIGANESAFGTSNIAITKNNLFGLNAVDAAPGQNASIYASAAACIESYAYSWLSYGYVQPGDWRFHGAQFGTKQVGLNVQYASDAYWGEKAAQYYYDLDKFFNFQDYNAYTIAVLNNNYVDQVYAKKDPNGLNVSSKYYQYKDINTSVVVLNEVTGPNVGGSTVWYQIMSDPTLDDAMEYYGDSKSNPKVLYRWNQRVYVPSVYFLKTNTGTLHSIPNVTIPTPSEPVPSPSPSTSPVPSPSPSSPSSSPSPEDNKKNISISEKVVEAGYRYQNGYLFGVTPGISTETIIQKFNSVGLTATASSQIAGTGVTISVSISELKETLTIVVYGDVDGDGSISAVDYVRVKNHIMGSSTLSGVNEMAANVNKDDSISAVDYVNIKNYIMGNSNVIEN